MGCITREDDAEEHVPASLSPRCADRSLENECPVGLQSKAGQLQLAVAASRDWITT